jgi:CBS domain-containing protein
MSVLRVRDLMSHMVFTVGPDDPVARVRERMDTHRIRHVPVIDDDGSLVGLVTERDMLRRAAAVDAGLPLSVEAEVLDGLRVREIMTSEVETVEIDELLANAAQTILENKFGCLPVVDGGLLVGILTEADFVRYVAATPPSRAVAAPAARAAASTRPRRAR